MAVDAVVIGAPQPNDAPMQLSHIALSLILPLALAACGGGGSSSSPSTETPAPAAAYPEFEGIWKPQGAASACRPDFPYRSGYHYRLRDITLKADRSQLNASVAVLVYSDLGCQTKLGLITERFDLSPQPHQVLGRDKVLQSRPSLTGTTVGSDGDGAGMNLSALPDGRLTGWRAAQLIADVQDNKLFLRVAAPGVPVDAQGFPTQFDADTFLLKN